MKRMNLKTSQATLRLSGMKLLYGGSKMRSTYQLNKTYRQKTKKIKMRPVTERHYKKSHPGKKSLRVHTVCPHCGKSISVVIK